MFRENGEVQTILDGMGFQIGEVVETIVTTRGVGGEPNAAPMGVLRTGPRTVEVKPFLDTTTYANLRGTGRSVANITYDVKLFLESTFKESGVKPEWFEENEDPPRLRDADAILSFSVLEETAASERRACFLCQIEWVRLLNPFPRVFSRGFAAAVEAIIHATRIEAFIKEGRGDEVEERLRMFDACREIVERVSPEGSPNRQVIRALEEKMRTWR
jgi:hypothetical protein